DPRRARAARRALRARDLRGRGPHGGEALEPRGRVRAGDRLPRQGARGEGVGADTMTAARRLGRVVRHGSAKPSTPVRLRSTRFLEVPAPEQEAERYDAGEQEPLA